MLSIRGKNDFSCYLKLFWFRWLEWREIYNGTVLNGRVSLCVYVPRCVRENGKDNTQMCVCVCKKDTEKAREIIHSCEGREWKWGKRESMKERIRERENARESESKEASLGATRWQKMNIQIFQPSFFSFSQFWSKKRESPFLVAMTSSPLAVF